MDTQIKKYARRQHGVISRSQVLETVTRQELRTALNRGDLERVERGIYRVGGMPKSWRSDLMAALLAAPGSVASHRSAAALWGLAGFPPGPIELTVMHGNHHRPGFHQTRSLDSIDVTTIDRIPVTRVARTLFDLSGAVTADRLEDALDDALCRRLVTFGRVQGRNSALKARGRANLDEVLKAWTPGNIPDSVAEMRVVRRLLAYGLPEPERQVWIGRYRVDLFYRDVMLVIEYTSFRWHVSRRRHERTNERRNELVALDYKVIDVTLADIKGDGRRLCRKVKAVLDRAATSPDRTPST